MIGDSEDAVLMDRQVVWGFLGAAGIAEKNWASVQRSGNGILKMVGSRDVGKAQAFIDQCQASAPFEVTPKAVAGYEEILADPEINAVYIPLPTGLRKDWVIRAAEAGKHILCEKPCAPNLADLEEMIAACETHKVQFMDGVMFMHNPRLSKIIEVVKGGEELGRLRRIESCFSFFGEDDFEDNIRINSKLEPLGALGDLGWYCVRMSLCCCEGDLPLRVRATLFEEKGGVPVDLRGDLIFGGSRTASFHCSFNTALEQSCRISGTKGALTLNDFVLPCDNQKAAFTIERQEEVGEGSNFSTRSVNQEVNLPGEFDSQKTLLFRNFNNLVLSGERDSYWPEISLQTQRVMDALMKSAHRDGEMVVFD